MDLNGKTVIYIGGFGGIGQKCIREFLEKGIKNLIIFDLNENVELLKELQQDFTNVAINFIKLDITNTKNIEEAYEGAFQKVGHFDVVVNGSGLMNDRFVDLTIQINLLGLIHSTLTAIKYMDKSAGGNGGLIVNISSVVGLIPTTTTGMCAVYAAAKNGVTAFTRSMGNPLFYARTGIAYITICPGFTDTPLLDAPLDKAIFDYCDPMAERFMRIKRQSATICAKNLVKAVELAKNGSVWLLDLDELKEVEMPVLWTPTFEDA